MLDARSRRARGGARRAPRRGRMVESPRGRALAPRHQRQPASRRGGRAPWRDGAGHRHVVELARRRARSAAAARRGSCRRGPRSRRGRSGARRRLPSSTVTYLSEAMRPSSMTASSGPSSAGHRARRVPRAGGGSAGWRRRCPRAPLARSVASVTRRRGGPQPGVRRDDERRSPNALRVGQLAAEVEAGQEAHHLAERRPRGRAQAPGERKRGARREQQLRRARRRSGRGRAGRRGASDAGAHGSLQSLHVAAVRADDLAFPLFHRARRSARTRGATEPCAHVAGRRCVAMLQRAPDVAKSTVRARPRRTLCSMDAEWSDPEFLQHGLRRDARRSASR